MIGPSGVSGLAVTSTVCDPPAGSWNETGSKLSPGRDGETTDTVPLKPSIGWAVIVTKVVPPRAIDTLGGTTASEKSGRSTITVIGKLCVTSAEVPTRLPVYVPRGTSGAAAKGKVTGG
jgi:hypothetical protein